MSTNKHLIDYNLFIYFVHTINLCLPIMCSIEFQGCNYMEDHLYTEVCDMLTIFIHRFATC